MSASGQKAFFFDRDGVINIDHGYISTPDDFEFTDGLFPILRTLQEKGYFFVIVTNQSGIGRGYYQEKDYQRVTDFMMSRFEAENIEIAGVYYCPHSPDANCSCRKPEPGMLLQAQHELNIDFSTSWMVGDKDSDMQAAEKAGIPNRVLLGGADSLHSTHMIDKLDRLLGLPV